ncbi:hypothetical protein DAEQUDRAFT_760421 [Daedalea quercina L-15889]|uniref:Uncharacterized protein n=1 Tax=Daedalea quercina L-15889 TaxID=1314783 RepID=A0A165KT24_9APHY|nr:hypothetical protein DAEQUDRAFT_760421 [Daedalea quercina L-15889]
MKTEEDQWMVHNIEPFALVDSQGPEFARDVRQSASLWTNMFIYMRRTAERKISDKAADVRARRAVANIVGFAAKLDPQLLLQGTRSAEGIRRAVHPSGLVCRTRRRGPACRLHGGHHQAAHPDPLLLRQGDQRIWGRRAAPRAPPAAARTAYAADARAHRPAHARAAAAERVGADGHPPAGRARLPRGRGLLRRELLAHVVRAGDAGEAPRRVRPPGVRPPCEYHVRQVCTDGVLRRGLREEGLEGPQTCLRARRP